MADRLWARVKKLPGPNGCWEWQGFRNALGYGQIGLPGRRVALVHRVAFELQVGPIPEGLAVCHRCDNPPCVRGDHLFTGTRGDNARDAAQKGRMHPGEATSGARLSADAVLAIRASTDHDLALADRYGVSRRTIVHVRSGNTWRHLLPDRPSPLQLF